MKERTKTVILMAEQLGMHLAARKKKKPIAVT